MLAPMHALSSNYLPRSVHFSVLFLHSKLYFQMAPFPPVLSFAHCSLPHDTVLMTSLKYHLFSFSPPPPLPPPVPPFIFTL